MSTAIKIIEAATAEGLTLNLQPDGQLKVFGAGDVVDRWVPRLRQHKAEIIEALREREIPLPSWCSAGCARYVRLVMLKENVINHHRGVS